MGRGTLVEWVQQAQGDQEGLGLGAWCRRGTGLKTHGKFGWLAGAGCFGCLPRAGCQKIGAKSWIGPKQG
jgi:hypothetical protein